MNGRAMRRGGGFSLIEVMAVLAVLAVLATLTLPGFRAQVMKSRRAEGREALLAVQLSQERHRASHIRYAERLEDLGQPAVSRGGLYRLRIVQADATRHAVEAVAQGSQAGDRQCQVLRLRLEHAAVHTTGVDDQGTEQANACWPQ